jgi:hypothetical protein
MKCCDPAKPFISFRENAIRPIVPEHEIKVQPSSMRSSGWALIWLFANIGK